MTTRAASAAGRVRLSGGRGRECEHGDAEVHGTACGALRRGCRVRPDVTAGQLTQTRGCDPTNDCHWDCVAAARDDLDGWDDLDERERESIREDAKWVARQRWTST